MARKGKAKRKTRTLQQFMRGNGEPKGKPSKRPRKPKTRPDVPGGAALIGHNGPELTEDERRALFLSHRTHWNQWKAKRAAVDAIERDLKATLKSDGFTVKQMKIADALATQQGEARVKDELRERLEVARWVGHPMGAQLDMFDDPDRTPISDRAYDEGKQASMENRKAQSHYAPDTEAYRSFMSGYADHQETLARGIKPTVQPPGDDFPADVGEPPFA